MQLIRVRRSCIGFFVSIQGAMVCAKDLTETASSLMSKALLLHNIFDEWRCLDYL
jgi:hypothetical protein